MAISAAAEKAPERLEALIYVSAFLPRNGESLLAIEGCNPKVAVPKNLIVSDDGVSGTIMPEKVHDLFYHDCSPVDASDAAGRPRPQALAPLSTPIHSTAERFGRVPRGYIECTEDRALAIEMQRDMISKSFPVTVRYVAVKPFVLFIHAGSPRPSADRTSAGQLEHLDICNVPPGDFSGEGLSR
jgi:hypothetical protein